MTSSASSSSSSSSYYYPTTFAYPTNMAYAWFSANQACRSRQCGSITNQRASCPLDVTIAAYSEYFLDASAGNPRRSVDGIPIRALEMGMGQGQLHPNAYDIVPRRLFEHPYHNGDQQRRCIGADDNCDVWNTQ